MSHKPMSMEAVMDEERREVLALLEGAKQNRRSSSIASAGRSASPYSRNPRSPLRSPMQSILDYSDLEAPPPSSRVPVPDATPSPHQSPPRPAPAQPIRSMLDVAGPPPPVPVRSMLDIGGPPPPILQHAVSAQSSPTSPTDPAHRAPLSASHHRHGSSGSGPLHPRSMSDAAGRPVEFGPRALQARGERADPTAGYQFADIITSRENPKLAKRTVGLSSSSNPAKRGATSMAEVMRGTDVSNLKLPGHTLPLRGRHSVGGARPAAAPPKSSSPHNRLGMRSKSPHVGINTRALSPAAAAFLADSHGIDMKNAYRRLSDAAFRQSGGSLSELPMRNRMDERGVNNHGRLAKDYRSPDGEALPEDSSEDNQSDSSDEEDELRGRKTARSFSYDQSPKSSESPVDIRKDGPKVSSLLAAAEEERVHVAFSQPYRSLLEPEIVVTNSSGNEVKPTKTGVHPANSFDVPSRSASRTPWDSDDEAEYTDIKRAQKLTLSMTPIMSTPAVQRSIRIIYRGDFAKVQKEATNDEHRRVRKYLVATDLSDESTHALEWAVGTVLRDGDTLVAIYCVDEEAGIPGVETAEDPKMRDQAQAVSATTTTGKLPEGHSLASLAIATGSNTTLSVGVPVAGSKPSLAFRNCDAPATGSSSPAPQLREKTRAEEERHHAVQDITDRIARLLRKTRLQVRVIVEVLHCKTPRHLITEVIDLVNPTMVILGSRGRSALKGVILGSFSNYLVTKSSVPVMVARKRLRKQGKYKRPPVHQVNNLSNLTARSLANAKID